MNKKVIIILSSILIIFIGIFLYTTFSKPKSVITTSIDTKTKQDISSKVSLILSEGLSNSSESVGYSYISYIDKLILTDKDKVRIAFNQTIDNKRLMTKDDVVKLMNIIFASDFMKGKEQGYNPVDKDYVIEGDIIATKYKELFNEEISHGNFTDNCPSFKYSKESNMYLLLSDCELKKDTLILYNKKNILKDGEDIIMYVDIATYYEEKDKTELHKGFGLNDVVIASLKIDGTNESEIKNVINKYKDAFGEYKFIFTKSDETYQIKQILKIS